MRPRIELSFSKRNMWILEHFRFRASLINANVRGAKRTPQQEMIRALERSAREAGAMPPWEQTLTFEDLQKRIEAGVEIGPGENPTSALPETVLNYIKKKESKKPKSP